MFAYFVGIALVGAGLGALVAHVGVERHPARGDPPAVAVIVLSIVGVDRRDVPAALRDHRRDRVRRRVDGDRRRAGDRAAIASAAQGGVGDDVWILYPTSPAPGQRWVPVAWIVLGLVGTGRAAGDHRAEEEVDGERIEDLRI